MAKPLVRLSFLLRSSKPLRVAFALEIFKPLLFGKQGFVQCLSLLGIGLAIESRNETIRILRLKFGSWWILHGSFFISWFMRSASRLRPSASQSPAVEAGTPIMLSISLQV